MHSAPSATVAIAALAWLWAAAAGAQNPNAQPPAESPPIAAVVNGEPIYVAELEIHYESIVKQRQLDPARANRSKAEILHQLINRELAMQVLERVGTLVSAKEIDDGVKQLETQLRQKRKLSLEQFARSRGITVESLRKDLFWRLAWDRYLERHLAEALEGYFEKHKKDLDGTEVRASHILVRPDKYSDTAAQLAAQAQKIRAAIEAGKITFEDAAQKFSAGPSRDRGGDLGFFPRKGVMLEGFAKVAFALEKGELSQPVNTVFGTHLIRVTDIKPGTRQWTQVIPEIRSLASAELLDTMADAERQKAKIEFSGQTPYFKPDTGQLVVPSGDAAQAATP
jgi:parvulin-like peptidyl-prolyl isomerase